jgi:hypothetical protein
VYREVDFPRQQRLFQFLREKAFAADLIERPILNAIARGFHQNKLAGDAGFLLELGSHSVRLRASKPGCAGTYSQDMLCSALHHRRIRIKGPHYHG